MTNHGSDTESDAADVDININALYDRDIYCESIDAINSYLASLIGDKLADVDHLRSILSAVYERARPLVYAKCLRHVIYRGLCQYPHIVQPLLDDMNKNNDNVIEQILEEMADNSVGMPSNENVVNYLFQYRDQYQFHMTELLSCSILTHHNDMVKKVLDTGIDVNQADTYYLNEATTADNIDALRLLLEYGLITESKYSLCTLLHLLHRPRILQLLLTHDPIPFQDLDLTEKQQEIYQTLLQMEERGNDIKKIFAHYIYPDYPAYP